MGRYRCCVLSAGMLVIAFGATGCSEPGGGAAVEPTVTIKPADLSTVGPGGGTSPGTSTPDGGTVTPGTVGNVSGRVVFNGSAPSFPALVPKGTAKKDGTVCAATEDITDKKLLVDSNGGLANVFIYLDKKPAGAQFSDDVSEPVTFDQKGCVFLTHALLCRTGQEVLVMSDDPVAHNTHTYPNRNSSANFQVPASDRKGTAVVYRSAEREPFPVKCDYHPWMQAYHLPLDHPYGAVTAPDGTFRIEGLPSGKHSFKIWHETANGNFLSRNYEITVQEGDNDLGDVSFEASQFNL